MLHRRKIGLYSPTGKISIKLAGVVLSRSKLETLKTILTSEYWLIASLCGAFFSFFALNRGGVVVFIDAGIVFLFINFISGKYRLKDIPASYWVTVAICGYLLGASVLFYPKTSHYRWMAYMVRMLGVVFAIHCLSSKSIKDWVVTFFCIVPAVAVGWQAVAFYVFKMPFGTFSNPHYLSSFSVLTIPAIVYSVIVTKGWYKFLFVPAVLLDLDLLLRIGSRPAILGLTVGSLFVAVFLIKGWWKWIGLLLILVGLSGLYFSGYEGVYSRFEELIVNLPKEERVYLWTASLDMLRDNSVTTWIFGSGIGNVRTVYPQYIPKMSHLIFPHLHFIEVLHDNGIVGAILLFGGLSLLFIWSIRFSKNTGDKNSRIFLQCLLVTFIGWLIHTGLTFPFYSKYSQYSLAFILGPLLAVLANKTLTLSETNSK